MVMGSTPLPTGAPFHGGSRFVKTHLVYRRHRATSAATVPSLPPPPPPPPRRQRLLAWKWCCRCCWLVELVLALLSLLEVVVLVLTGAGGGAGGWWRQRWLRWRKALVRRSRWQVSQGEGHTVSYLAPLASNLLQPV